MDMYLVTQSTNISKNIHKNELFWRQKKMPVNLVIPFIDGKPSKCNKKNWDEEEILLQIIKHGTYTQRI